jgi:hypothetical protein
VAVSHAADLGAACGAELAEDVLDAGGARFGGALGDGGEVLLDVQRDAVAAVVDRGDDLGGGDAAEHRAGHEAHERDLAIETDEGVHFERAGDPTAEIHELPVDIS